MSSGDAYVRPQALQSSSLPALYLGRQERYTNSGSCTTEPTLEPLTLLIIYRSILSIHDGGLRTTNELRQEVEGGSCQYASQAGAE
jgi:hypothetical protein